MNTHLSVGTHASRFVCGLAVGMHLLFGAGRASAQGTLEAWGDTAVWSPIPSGLTDVVQIGAGERHTVALRANGTLVSWGPNNYNAFPPANVGSVQTLKVGMLNTLILLSSGEVLNYGSAGLNPPPNLGPCVAIDPGGYHGMALKADGRVVCWQSGVATPTPPSGGNLGAVKIAAGYTDLGVHGFLAVRSDGQLVNWDSTGQAGTIPPAAQTGSIKQIDLGGYHSVVLRNDGSIHCWFHGTPNIAANQCEVPSDLLPCVAISAGWHHTLALQSNGIVRAWGRSVEGQTTPPSGVSFGRISAGWGHSIGIRGNPIDEGDCNNNLIPDSEEITEAPWLDCNENGLLDICQDVANPSVPIKWTAVDGGAFQDLSSWCLTAPTTTSSISFPYNLHYDVVFSQNRSVRNMQVGAGFATLKLNGRTLTLSGSTLPSQSFLRIGTVENTAASLGLLGGTVSAAFTEVGQLATSEGSLFIGAGGVAASTQEICVGCSGVGTMNVVSGGRVVSQKGVIGKTEAGRGEVLVQGVAANPQNNTPPIQSTWDSTLGVDIRNGTLTVGPEGVINSPAVGVVLYSGGVLQGTGRINGTVTNFGAAAGGCGNSGVNGVPGTPRRGGLVPGGSAGDTQSAQGVPTIGTLTINGIYQQIEANPLLGTNSGSLLIEVMPGANGPEYDRLVVNGTASFGGGLFVEFPGGDPGSFDALPIITASSVDPDRNMFDVAVMPGLPDGRFVKVDPVQGLKGGGGGISISTSTLSELLGFGTASSSGLSLEPLAAAVADFDGQNGPDVAVTTKGVTATSPGNLFILFNDGQGGLQQAVQWPGLLGIDPVDIVAAPLRANTNLTDLAVVNKGSDTLQVLYNEGNGTFTSQGVINLGTGTGPVAVAAGSIYSEQGLAGAAKDLIVANGDSNSILVFKVFGPFPWGLPLPLPTPIRPSDVDGVDIDNNRTCDILVTARGASTVTAYTFDRKEQLFSDGIDFLTGEDPVSMALADLDGDGRTDVTTVNSESNSVSVLVNRTLPDGQVNFAPAVSLPTGPDPVSVVTGDFDLDTLPGDPPDLDIALTARASSNSTSRVVKILRNDRQDGVLVLAPAEDQIVPGSPKIVLAAEMDPVEGVDLVTVGQNSAATANFNSFLGNASVRPAVRSKKPCIPGDVDCDGAVDGNDLAALLAAYGTSEPSADFNRDGVVAGEDLAILLAAWGSGTS